MSHADQERLIASLRQLSQGTDLEQVLDTDAVLRYFVVHNFVCNFDSYTGSMVHNYYLYEEDGALSMIPWDYNLAFGSFQEQMSATELVNFPIDTPVSGGDLESRPMVAWIFQDEVYTQQYHQYFSQFLTDFFDSGALEEMIDDTAALLDPYVQQDPTKFCTYEEFQTAAETLKQFCALRAQSVSGQLSGAIPATSDGQAAEPSALIDAAGLELSDLGSSGGGAPEGPEQGGDIGQGGRGGPQARGGEAGSAPGDPTASASISDAGVITTSALTEGGAPMPEDGTQTQQTEEPAREDSGVTDGAQGQTADPFGGADGQNQNGQRQPADFEGAQQGSAPAGAGTVQAERETAVLLAASLVCLLIGLAVVCFYPRKH